MEQRRVRSKWAYLCSLGLLGILTAAGALQADDQGLTAEKDFALIAKGGFDTRVDGSVDPLTGDPILEADPLGSHMNTDTWAMTTFNGRLFVGTLRNGGCKTILTSPATVGTCPVATAGPNERAEIWRYTPDALSGIAGAWTRVFQSAMVSGTPRHRGYRSAVVCDAGGSERMYVSGVGGYASILNTADGTTFQESSTVGLQTGPGGDNGYSRLACFTNQNGVRTLVASPVATPQDNDIAKPGRAVVLMNANPGNTSSPWQTVSASGFGDPNNIALFNMRIFDGELYFGVTNRVAGAEIWKTAGCTGPASLSPCNATYTRVLSQGAGRAELHENGTAANEAVAIDMETFDADDDGADDYLYVAIGHIASGQNFVRPELIRFNTNDDTWEHVLGKPRLNAASILNFQCSVPLTDVDGDSANDDCPVTLSGMGPGFGAGYANGAAAYFWKMVKHDSDGDGRRELYVGTLDRGANDGADLWRSDDGISFTPVTIKGFGLSLNGGIRNMASADEGLYVGSMNRSTNEPNGGTHVYLGTCTPDGPLVAAAGAVTTTTSPGLVALNGQIYIGYDDETLPDGSVAVTLDGGKSANRYCGHALTSYQWYSNAHAGSCGSLTSGHSDLLASTTTHPTSLPTGANFTDYTFTLKVTAADAGGPVCDEVVVRASANLPPDATITSNPPATPQGSPDRLKVTLIDADRNGFETLTINGSCTDPENDLASCAWSAPLPGVTFANPNSLNTTATVAASSGLNILLTAVDGDGNQQVAILTVQVNRAPDALNDTATTSLNTPVTIAVLVNDTDADGDTIFIDSVTQPANGTAVTNPNGTVTYTPNTGFSGSNSFTYTVRDFTGGMDTATVTVTVSGGSSTPAAPSAVVATTPGPLTISVTWTDNANNETSYRMQACRVQSCTWTTVNNNLPANTTQHSFPVQSASTFRVRVRACNAQCSSWVTSNNVVVQ